MTVRILTGDCRSRLLELPEASVQCCVTSPPYFCLRDYGVDGQIGLEETPDDFVAQMVDVFREVRRVLRDDGTLWLNLGDSYANDGKWGGSSGGKHAKALHGNSGIGRKKVTTGLKPKDLIGVPWRVAFALQADGWWLRSDIIWHKPNPMPESIKDRPTSAHEHVFLMAKSERYFYDADAIRDAFDTEMRGSPHSKEYGRKTSDSLTDRAAAGSSGGGFVRNADGKNARNVWTIAPQPFADAHFATMAPELAERCIKAGSRPGDTILDPFGGAGTTGLVADRLGRNAVLLELNPEYAAMAERRIRRDAGLFADTEAA